ncbi:MAG: hypothetical protein ABIG96_03985 [Candidatus Micrarchaeota archaeon]
MAIYYLSDLVMGTDFLYSVIFLTFVIWMVLKYFFHFDSAMHALILAVMAIIFLPFIVYATQIGPAFVIILLIGSLALSQTYRWPLSTSMMIMVVALLAGAMLLPAY